MSNSNRLLGAALLGTVGLFTLPALSATYTPDDLLRQYNIITFGDLTLNDEVEGRAYVGGDLIIGKTTQLMFDMTANEAGFTDQSVVAGKVYGPLGEWGPSSSLNVNGGHLTVGGNIQNLDFVNLNGSSTASLGGAMVNAKSNQLAKIQQGQTGTPGFSDHFFTADVEQAFLDASASLAALDTTGTGSWNAAGNRLSFGAAPIDGVTVYSLSYDDLLSVPNLSIDLNGADTVVFNVSGLGGGTLVPNFITDGADWESMADHIVWNFYEATTVDLNTRFWGMLLAPLAHFNGADTNYEGTIVAKSATTHGEMHVQNWRGVTTPDSAPPPVPVPAALPLLGAGLAALALFRRRRLV